MSSIASGSLASVLSRLIWSMENWPHKSRGWKCLSAVFVSRPVPLGNDPNDVEMAPVSFQELGGGILPPTHSTLLYHKLITHANYIAMSDKSYFTDCLNLPAIEIDG